MKNVLLIIITLLSGCMFNAIDTKVVSLDYNSKQEFKDFKLSEKLLPSVIFAGTEGNEQIVFQSSNGGFVEIDINKAIGSALKRWQQERFTKDKINGKDTLKISIPNIEIDKNVFDPRYKAYELKLGIQLKVEYFNTEISKTRYFNEKKKIVINDHDKLILILKDNLNSIVLNLITKIDNYYDSIDKN